MAGQRTVIDRAMFDRLIDALLDGDEDARIKTAKELTDVSPSWWSGPTLHRSRVRQDAGQ